MRSRPLTGEPISLDLVGTLWREHGEPVDALADEPGLDAWLNDHPELRTPEWRRTLGPLTEAREAIRASLERGDPTGLDAVLDHGRIRLRFAAEPEIELDDPLWEPAWRVVRDHLELVRSDAGERIRHCEGDGCVLWFLDVSRNGRRRWCSMAGCGNRAKARAHYARSR